MILEPDYFGHWKTKLLVVLTQDQASPLMPLKLWAHCQQRKDWIFPGMKNEVLKSICEWHGDAAKLREFLEESGFIEKDPTCVHVHQWDQVNWQLVRNWENGKKGGRPKTHEKPTDNPRETHEKPTNNPQQTHEEPIDKIREEKIEKTEKLAGLQKPESSQPVKKSSNLKLTDDEFLVECKRIYTNIDVDTEYTKYQGWFLKPQNRKKKPTRARFINWLNRADPSMSGGGGERDRVTGLLKKGGK